MSDTLRAAGNVSAFPKQVPVFFCFGSIRLVCPARRCADRFSITAIFSLSSVVLTNAIDTFQVAFSSSLSYKEEENISIMATQEVLADTREKVITKK